MDDIKSFAKNIETLENLIKDYKNEQLEIVQEIIWTREESR